MPEGSFSVREVQRLEALCPAALSLFGRDGVFSTFGWYRSTLDHALPEGTCPVFATVERHGETLGVFAMQRGQTKAVSALTTPYTCLWQPLLAASVARSAADMAGIGKAFATFCGGSPATRLEAMDADAPWLRPLLTGIQAAGLRPLRFEHFGNWHETVAGMDWETYLAGRPGALREAIRRRSRKLIGKMGARLSIIEGGDPLEPAIAAYEKIYASSWKKPEPFALFNAAFMRASAAEGSLRLGLLSLADTPLAAQFWVVRDGCATVLKLAHDEDSRALSPGTVLTALMIRHMLEHEGVASLDFGRGDDPYKRDWTSLRRPRIGFVLADPRSLRGGAAILRHAAGVARRRYLGGVPR